MRSHALLSLALAGAPVIQHDFHEPAGPQQERDRLFWQAVRWRLAGQKQQKALEGAGAC